MLEKLEVSGSTYSFDYVIPTTSDLNSYHDLGMCDLHTKKITINLQGTKDLIAQTIFHEILHAICYEYGINSLNGDGEAHEDLDRLANALYDVLKRNQLLEIDDEAFVQLEDGS